MVPISPFAAPGALAPPPGLDIPALCRLGAAELGGLLRARQVSAREIVTAFLDHIDRVNPAHNAVVSLRPRPDILAEADAADARLAAGEACGPLHGLPIAIKDLAATRGLRTTFGSPIHRDFVPDADDLCVARIRAAGAIIIGKTNTPEFGLGSQTYNPVFGATRNAFDPALCAGGSSGGAAVALALRLLPVADGSDMGGSLRNPAGYNNVYGLRPSQGRVPNPASPDQFYGQLATEGPMARGATDLALLLGVMAGPDPRAPLALPADTTLDGRLPASRSEPFRIAWFGDLGGHLAMEPGVLDVCEAALRRLEATGCRVDPVLPSTDFEALWQAFVVLRQFSLITKFRPLLADPATRALLKPEALWEINQAMTLSAEAIADAASVRTAWFRTCASLFQTYDGLALPSAQLFPFDVRQNWPAAIAGRAMDSYHRWMEVVAPGTLSGCPVLCLPAGFDGEYRAMGLQVIGRPSGDLSLLRLARRYETAG